MEVSVLLRKGVLLFVFFALLSPVFYLSLHLPLEALVWDAFLGPVLKGAFIQSLLSTLVTLVLGLLTGLGLIEWTLRLSPVRFSFLQFLILLPCFLPPIILVTLITYSLGFLPTGLMGVVFFHALMNTGLMALVFYSFLKTHAPSWIRFAQVAQVSPRRFIFKGLLIELSWHGLLWGFYLFILYFFSFSIPFLVGGTGYGGVEVFIYEKILFLGHWGEAIQYSLLLFVCLLLVSSLLGREELKTNPSLRGGEKDHLLGFLKFPFFSLFPLLPLFLILMGLGLSLGKMEGVFSLISHWEEIRGTLVVGLSVGGLVFLWLTLISFAYPLEQGASFLLAFVHPGWVLVGFAFLLMGGRGAGMELLKLSFSLSLIYTPFLYRLHFHEKLKALEGQVQIASSFTCPWWKVFSQILWPQCLSPMAFLSGVAGLWSCGDFALTSLLVQSPGVSTLALKMQNLLGNYRLEQALGLLWPLLLCSALVFFSFKGVTHVHGRKAFL